MCTWRGFKWTLVPAQVASPQSQMSSPGGPKPVKFDLSAGPPQVILPGKLHNVLLQSFHYDWIRQFQESGPIFVDQNHHLLQTHVEGLQWRSLYNIKWNQDPSIVCPVPFRPSPDSPCLQSSNDLNHQNQFSTVICQMSNDLTCPLDQLNFSRWGGWGGDNHGQTEQEKERGPETEEYLLNSWN